MRRLSVLALFTTLTVLFLNCAVNGDDMDKKNIGRTSLKLSKKLQRILSAEMNSVQHGMTNLSIAIPAGDWKSIEETARSIRDGYILEKKLSKKEMQEFMKSLPEEYNRIDKEYKQLAQGMIDAANKGDTDEVNLYFYKLNGTCIECHVKYAKERFPGF